MNIQEKLLAIQLELKAPKDLNNDFGKYKYRSAEGILEALKPICAKHKAVCYCSDTMINIGDRYYVEATARLTDLEKDDMIVVTASAREADQKKGMDSAQVTGACSSYARKYALGGLFSLDDNKDADTNEYTKQLDKAQVSEDKEIIKLQEKACETAKLLPNPIQEKDVPGAFKHKYGKKYFDATVANLEKFIADMEKAIKENK